MTLEVDFLVIGSGIAGLSFALKAAEHGTVIIISKDRIDETNTRYAQGGIASVISDMDHFDKHISDTLEAGDGLCNRNVVEMVVTEAPQRIHELINWGVSFDRTADGNFDLGIEGGHSEYRVLHHKDNTGYEIQRKLTNMVESHPNIQILEYHFAVDLITQHHLGKVVKRIHTDTECYGSYVLNLRTNEVNTILSKITFIATGGSGNVYQTTTNPLIATGDGIAMVHRAKGVLENMEFFQFHPTALYNPGERPSFLITEALRGFGGILRTKDGSEFMGRYHPQGAMAPRDIVARAIDFEMKTRGDEYVYLDCTHLNKEQLLHHFPNIYSKCLTLNIDIAQSMIPVVPAAHYQCGGIKVDSNSESTIHRLYVGGEAACTGLHGANRLASNSLLEAVVFSHRAANDAIQRLSELTINRDIPVWNTEGTGKPKELVMITHNLRELQSMMNDYVGIVRSQRRLEMALSRLEIIYNEVEEHYEKSLLSRQLCELRNLINVAYLIIRAASHRRKSKGLHYIID